MRRLHEITMVAFTAETTGKKRVCVGVGGGCMEGCARAHTRVLAWRQERKKKHERKQLRASCPSEG